MSSLMATRLTEKIYYNCLWSAMYICLKFHSEIILVTKNVVRKYAGIFKIKDLPSDSDIYSRIWPMN